MLVCLATVGEQSLPNIEYRLLRPHRHARWALLWQARRPLPHHVEALRTAAQQVASEHAWVDHGEPV